MTASSCSKCIIQSHFHLCHVFQPQHRHPLSPPALCSILAPRTSPLFMWRPNRIQLLLPFARGADTSTSTPESVPVPSPQETIEAWFEALDGARGSSSNQKVLSDDLRACGFVVGVEMWTSEPLCVSLMKGVAVSSGDNGARLVGASDHRRWCTFDPA